MRKYVVRIDNEATGGVDAALDVDVSDWATADTLEATIAEATRRLLAAASADERAWDTRALPAGDGS